MAFFSKERFVPVFGFEGLYEVSSNGRIYSKYSNKILKHHHVGNTARISFKKNGVQYSRTVSRVVLSSFTMRNDKDYHVLYVDGDVSNIRLSNLRWEVDTVPQDPDSVNSPNDEKWVDVLGFEGIYMVSNEGRICSIKNQKNLMLRVTLAGDSNSVVTLWNNKKRTNISVARIVYESFVGKIKGDYRIGRYNKNRFDNRLPNLFLEKVADLPARATYKNKKVKSLGVGIHNGKFRARILRNKKQITIGEYDTEKDASDAYVNASKEFEEKGFVTLKTGRAIR